MTVKPLLIKTDTHKWKFMLNQKHLHYTNLGRAKFILLFATSHYTPLNLKACLSDSFWIWKKGIGRLHAYLSVVTNNKGRKIRQLTIYCKPASISIRELKHRRMKSQGAFHGFNRLTTFTMR